MQLPLNYTVTCLGLCLITRRLEYLCTALLPGRLRFAEHGSFATLSVGSSSHLFGFGGLPLGTRDLHPLNLFSVRYNSRHRKAAGPSTCYECGR